MSLQACKTFLPAFLTLLNLNSLITIGQAPEPARAEASFTSQARDQNIPRLEPGQPVERELAGGQTHTYQLALAVNQYLRVAVEQKGIDVVVTLFGPNSQKLIEVDSPNGAQGPETLSQVTEAPGNYRLEVRSPEMNAAAGRYEAKIEELRPAGPQDRTRITVDRMVAEADRAYPKRTAESLRKAIENYQAALPLIASLNDHKLQARALRFLGVSYYYLGEYRKALDCYEQSLSIYHEINERAGEASLLNNIGLIYFSFGEPRKALDHYLQAIALHRAAGNRAGEQDTLANLAGAYYELGERQKALDYYHQALSAFRASAYREGEAQMLNNLSVIYNARGEAKQALDYAQLSLTLSRSTGDRRNEAVALANVASVYKSLGENRRALDHYEQALALNRVSGNRAKEVETLSTIGSIYYDSGELEKALSHFNQALSISRALGRRQLEAGALSNFASAYVSLGRLEEALDFANQSLRIRRAIGDPRGEAVTLSVLGRIHRLLGDKKEALSYHQQALTRWQAVGERRGESRELFLTAEVERDLRDFDAAQSHAEAGLKILESLRGKAPGQELRDSLFASTRRYYEFYIDLLMQMREQRPRAGFDAMSLQASERARARSLLELLTEARADIRQGVDQTLLERERELQQSLNAKAERQTRLLSGKHTKEEAEAAAKEVEDLIAEYQEVEARIRAASPRYAALTQPQPLGLVEIQQLLDEETLLLEYALGDERSYMWVVSPTSLASYQLPKRAEIEAMARRFYDMIKTEKPNEAATEAALDLSKILLAPLAAQPGKKRLLIVADGALQYLPFAALPSPAAEETRMASPEPLIATREIIYLPSASTLAVLRREMVGRSSAEKAVAVLADPVFASDDIRLKHAKLSGPEKAGESAPASDSRAIETPLTRSAQEAGVIITDARFPRLIGSRREAAGILALVPERERMQALDFTASRATATNPELAEYRIVHFATHGLLNSKRPELSGVVLSLVDEQGRPQDGFLRLHELYNLKLPVELVVLSACQTGLGKEIKGEGLVGLTRGFMYAGAPRVVASLWKVDDKATSELMKLFYQGMLGERHLRPAEALRAAQLAMSKQKQWRSPYYWAAFAMQGEWR